MGGPWKKKIVRERERERLATLQIIRTINRLLNETVIIGMGSARLMQ